MATATIEAVVATSARASSTRTPLGAFVWPVRFPRLFMARARTRLRLRSTLASSPRFCTPTAGHNTIFDLNVEGSSVVKAMIVDWQHEPIKGKLLHIDLKRIAMDKTMRVSVPIQLVGTFRSA